jgi:hypothetical protein
VASTAPALPIMKWRRLKGIGEASTSPYAGSPGAFR